MISTDEATKMNKAALAILSAGHMVTNINQGALPALLPFFNGAFNLSYTTAGIILLASNLTSSVIQPAFGYLSDRRPIGWFLPGYCREFRKKGLTIEDIWKREED